MASDKPSVTIYTDGGAEPNPGPGGWGVVLIHDATGRVKELSGGDPATTNNRMELTAAWAALDALKQPCKVVLHSDSAYVVQGMTRWVEKWARDGWVRGRKKEPIPNADLWQLLRAAAAPHDITWRWVKGHSGDPYNERADALATREIRAIYEEIRASEPADAEIYLVVSARGAQGFWAASIRYQGEEYLIYGREENMTANQLDILAAASALSDIPEGSTVRIYSLSDYLRNGASQWIKNWKQRGWVTRAGEEVKNRELWEWLDDEMSRREVEWPSVKEDPSFELAFEDVGRRAQEAIEEEIAREQGGPFFDDDAYGDEM
ncbi:MAG: ribonuclease HI [Aggregatilineales bacterium]|nr:ribonuclease HI [Aggregatilineales bacterium]